MSTLPDWYRDGGPVMHFILLAALLGAAVIVERAYVIVVKSRINGREFIERVLQLVRSGKADDAIKLCVQSRAALPDMGLLILRSRSLAEGDLQNVSRAAALTVLPKLTRRLQYLPMLAKVAILLGMVGAISGVQEALTATAAVSLGDNAGALASGVAMALTPLGFGLSVAIPLSVGHAYLVSQSATITEQIEEFSVRLINALIDRPDVRLGHR